MSAFKKVKRMGKRASKFRFTCIVQSVLVELNTKRWCPHDICIVWSRRARKYSSQFRSWEPSVTNSLRGEIVWPEENPVDFSVTFYKDAKSPRFEAKEWDFLVVDRDRLGKKKVLAKSGVNMAKFQDLAVDTRVTLELKPVSKKVGRVTLEMGLVCEFLKEGKATDEDMVSMSSARSFSGLSDDFDALNDSGSDHRGSREDLTRSYDSPGPPSPFMPLPSEVSPEQVLLWAESVTSEYRTVKLSNLSTSWRNGLGFLAIIRHFKPELVDDFASLSPLNIRDNNSLVRELCRSLSIHCPIKPDQMDSTALPNPDVIAGFVYQLFVHLDNGMPQTLPPLPPSRSGKLSGGDLTPPLRHDLTPPGVRKCSPQFGRRSPLLSRRDSDNRDAPVIKREVGSSSDLYRSKFVKGKNVENSSFSQGTGDSRSNSQEKRSDVDSLKEAKSFDSGPLKEKEDKEKALANDPKNNSTGNVPSHSNSRLLNPSPDGVIIHEYEASPTFQRAQFTMYGSEEADRDSSDEESTVVVLSNVPFSPTSTGTAETFLTASSEFSETCSESTRQPQPQPASSGNKLASRQSLAGQGGTPLSSALKEIRTDRDVFSDGSDSGGVASARSSRVSVEDVKLSSETEEVAEKEMDVTLPDVPEDAVSSGNNTTAAVDRSSSSPAPAQETPGQGELPQSKPKEDGKQEGKGAEGVSKRALPSKQREKRRQLPVLPGGLGAHRGRSASLPVVTAMSQEVTSLPVLPGLDEEEVVAEGQSNPSEGGAVLLAAAVPRELVRTKGESSNQVPSAGGRGPPPPRPSKQRRKGSLDSGVLLAVDFESLPIVRLPQPRRCDDSPPLAEEPFERPSTADLPRSGGAPVDRGWEERQLKKGASVDLLADQSPSQSSRRRRNQAPSKPLMAKNLSSMTPSLSALSVASQPPKAQSEKNLLQEIEETQREECVEDLAIKKGSLSRGLLKGVPDSAMLLRDQSSSSPITEESQQDSSLAEEEMSEEDSRLLSVVEYHQEQLDTLTRLIAEADKEGELLQMDLRNASTRGDRNRAEELTDDWLALLKKKNELTQQKTGIYILHEEERIGKREYEVKRELKKSEGIEEYQKTKEQKEGEEELLSELMELVNARDKLEQRKLAHEVMGENDRESLSFVQENMPQIVLNEVPSNKPDCVIM